MVLMRNGGEYTTSHLRSEMARMGYRLPLLGWAPHPLFRG